jgi:tellurite resistance protein TerC
MDALINHPSVIIVFAVVITLMLLLDLGVFNRKSHEVSSKEAAVWSIVWISISMLFSGFIYYTTHETSGLEKFAQFQSAYWIEKALSVDNLFVFILVFGYFNVPRELHHKVLFWGIIGALALRAFFIFSGVGMIKYTYLPTVTLMSTPLSINVILTSFGAFLVYAGVKSWFVDDDDDGDKDFSTSPGARVVHRFFRVSDEFEGDRFFAVKNGVRIATPLLVVVGVIEFTDLLFAVDSIPAIFSIAPDDPFILYTSNIFAILGLRSLYFLLANFMHLFSRLKYGLAVILSFIGIKMIIAPIYHIPSTVSLAIVGGVLAVSTLASVVYPQRGDR